MSLTDEDKQWLSEQFATFATKADLERFATKTDLQAYATKADLERVETALLTEFHKWASPNEARLRSHTAAIRALDMELEALSDRVTKLEPPQA